MRTQHSRFTEQQIAFVLDQVSRGASVEGTCRKAGISSQTYYRWRAKYAGLKPAEIRRLHEIENENKRLKRLLAALLVVKPAPTGTALVALPSPPHAALPSPAAAPGGSRYWLSHSAYLGKLPTGHGHDLRARGQALLKRAQAWTAARAELVAGRSDVDRSAKLWAWLRKTWRVRKVLVLCFAGGLIGGFAMGLGPTAEDDAPAPVPVDMSVRVNSHGVSSTMDKGWSRPQAWGRWMTAGSASILLGFDGPARGDVELLVEARARLAQGQPQQTLIVRFNDTELGRWQLPTEARDLRRRFIVPVAVFNKSMAAKLDFALDGKAPLTPVFGLEAVSLRDARFLVDYRGFVDECRNGTYSGWAVAEGTAVSVAASIDGFPVAATLVSTHRSDLAAHGLPDDAGFRLTLTEPVPAGTEVDVRFANGRSLNGSPCKP